MKLLALEKRKTCLIQKPQEYGYHCDICGGSNLHWSEWEGLIWCYDCEKDLKGDGGIFDGPVPIGACELMGMSFDRIDLETGDVIPFDQAV